jgi:hypothetical protein
MSGAVGHFGQLGCQPASPTGPSAQNFRVPFEKPRYQTDQLFVARIEAELPHFPVQVRAVES